MAKAKTDDLKVLRLLEPQGCPDAIECDGQRYVPQNVCTYEPSVYAVRFDENDNEIDTFEHAYDCSTFTCSACGFEMLFGYDMGWFEDEPPYKPFFKFCPNCGARVVMGGEEQ